MVFDNADVLSPAELEAYLPPGRGGNILITSRNSAMQHLTLPENSLEVTEMKENDAIELLLKSSCLDPSWIDFQVDASEIVRELFFVPLAIDQAGAYIASGATSIGDYLAKYFEHRKTLLSHSQFTGASKYNRTVYETWELSYKEIKQQADSDDSHKANAANTAMIILELFPFFHHQEITEEIFSYAALAEDTKKSNSKLPLASSLLDRRLLPLNKSGTWDNFVFREGIRILLSFSLIKKGPSDCAYTMHPLIHTWGRDRLTLNERKECCLRVYVTLSCSLRWDVGQPYGFRRTLVTHVKANMEYFKSEGNQNIVSYMDDAYAKFGRLLQEQGHFEEAEILGNKVLDTRNRILGVEDPNTIKAMGSLISTYHRLRRYTKAEKLGIQVLDARNRILGAEHPDTIKAMGHLVLTYSRLRKYTEAEKLGIQVLDKSNRILGVKHPYTIQAMENLAITYYGLRKYTEAEKLGIQVLDTRTRILGVEHRETLETMANVAATCRKLRKYTEAEKLGIQVLDAMNRILGVEHPNTIKAMGHLAATCRKLGKYTEAEKLRIQVLDARTRIFGVEHPETITAMKNLAVTYRSQARYTEAEKLETQAHELESRVPGTQSSPTITTMANVQEAQEIQVLDAGSTVPGGLHSTQVVLNPPVQAVLTDMIMNPEKNGMYFGKFCLNPL